MNLNKLFVRLISTIGLVLMFSSGTMAAPAITVKVRAEPVGADIVYHYVLTHSGPEPIINFEVAVAPSGYGCEGTLCSGNYFGTLTALPIGTTWLPGTGEWKGWELPALSPGSTTQPGGWTPVLIGLKDQGPVKMQWTFSSGPVTSPGSGSVPFYYVRQPINNFSVRVPAGPASTAEYMSGLFHVKYIAEDTSQDMHAAMTSALTPPPAPPSLTVPANVPMGTVAPFYSYGISWGSSGADASYYNVQVATEPSWVYAVNYPNQTGLTMTISGSKNIPVRNFHRVQACNADKVCGDFRSETVGTVAGILGIPGPMRLITVPPAPATGTTGYRVSWRAPLNPLQSPPSFGPLGSVYQSPPSWFELEESTAVGFGAAAKIYSGTDRSFLVSGKTSGAYYYRVRGCNSAGCGPYLAGANGSTVP